MFPKLTGGGGGGGGKNKKNSGSFYAVLQISAPFPPVKHLGPRSFEKSVYWGTQTGREVRVLVEWYSEQNEFCC